MEAGLSLLVVATMDLISVLILAQFTTPEIASFVMVLFYKQDKCHNLFQLSLPHWEDHKNIYPLTSFFLAYRRLSKALEKTLSLRTSQGLE